MLFFQNHCIWRYSWLSNHWSDSRPRHLWGTRRSSNTPLRRPVPILRQVVGLCISGVVKRSHFIMFQASKRDKNSHKPRKYVTKIRESRRRTGYLLIFSHIFSGFLIESQPNDFYEATLTTKVSFATENWSKSKKILIKLDDNQKNPDRRFL